MPIVPILVQFLILLKEDISMKNLLKITAIAALTFSSISAFAASQQAEEVKKFKAWEETAGQKLEASLQLLLPLQVAMWPQLKLLLQNLIKKQQNM